MENVLMAPHYYLGHEASPWRGCHSSQFPTPMPTAREACLAAKKAAANTIEKYDALFASHIFSQWHHRSTNNGIIESQNHGITESRNHKSMES